MPRADRRTFHYFQFGSDRILASSFKRLGVQQLVEFLIDILDDRLDAIEAENDCERLRLYFELWQAGVVDPLHDPGVVVIATLDSGPRPGRVVVNDGEGGYGETH